MNAQISAAWDKVQSTINDFIILLPNLVLALIVFAIFFLVAKAIKRLVKRLTRNPRSKTRKMCRSVITELLKL